MTSPRRRWRASRVAGRLLAGVVAVSVLNLAGVAGSQPGSDSGPASEPMGSAADAASGSGDSKSSGERVYARYCSVCHGVTGLGLEEAREAFPEDHRRCSRCHRPGNPPTMSYEEIETRQHNMFDIGVPPPVRGEGSMAALADRDALWQYLAATMPRWNPGSLSDAEYRAVAEFLLELNGR